MTTMALTPAPVRRLFDRIDFAPRPLEAALGAFLETWERLRAGQVAPRRARAADALGRGASLFVRAEECRDYEIEHASAALRELLGDVACGAPAQRRAAAPAARLRRLFDLTLEKGEPTLASFRGEDGTVVEALAAPLMETDGGLGAVALVHHIRRGTSVPPHSALPPADPAALILFALGGSRALGTEIAQRLRISVAPHEERDFEDGEHKIRPLRSVRNRDVYVLADLASSPGRSVNDKLCKLLFFVGALKQSAARRVTLVAPYLCYARKERQTKPRDPVVTRYLAQMLEAVGLDRVVTVTPHDLAAFQNAFRCETEPLDVDALFARALALRGSRSSRPILEGKSAPNCFVAPWSASFAHRSARRWSTRPAAWERSAASCSPAMSEGASASSSTTWSAPGAR